MLSQLLGLLAGPMSRLLSTVIGLPGKYEVNQTSHSERQESEACRKRRC